MYFKTNTFGEGHIIDFLNLRKHKSQVIDFFTGKAKDFIKENFKEISELKKLGFKCFEYEKYSHGNLVVKRNNNGIVIEDEDSCLFISNGNKTSFGDALIVYGKLDVSCFMNLPDEMRNSVLSSDLDVSNFSIRGFPQER